MKTRLLFLVFTCTYLFSNSQEFAPAGAKWHYSFIPWSYPNRIEPVLVESVKDTIINNLNCRKMSGIGSNYIYSSGNKVFLFNNYANEFVKIYDFDLLAGDTLSFRYGWDTTYSMYRIDSIGYTTINAKIKKIQYITPGMPNMNINNWVFYGYNIEGIGNNNYLFPQFALADPLINGGLRCYEDSIIGYYNSGLVTICDSIIMLSVKEYKSVNFNVYPNPAADFIYIENITENSQIEIYTIDGKLQRAFIAKENTKVDARDFSTGLYLLKIITNKGIAVKKFVKQ